MLVMNCSRLIRFPIYETKGWFQFDTTMLCFSFILVILRIAVSIGIRERVNVKHRHSLGLTPLKFY